MIDLDALLEFFQLVLGVRIYLPFIDYNKKILFVGFSFFNIIKYTKLTYLVNSSSISKSRYLDCSDIFLATTGYRNHILLI